MCDGGKDCILDLRSGSYLQTDIIDNGKDYLSEMYVEKGEQDIDVTQPVPHGNAKPIIGYRPKGATLLDYMPKCCTVETHNRFSPSLRHP